MEQTLMFLRAPRPGETKTRLIPTLGAEKAVELYRLMVERTVDELKQVRRPGHHWTGLVDPPNAVAEVRRWLGPGVWLHAQSGGNLGERLEQAFRNAFDIGSERVVAIGTDCLDFSRDHVEAAFEALDGSDAVFGPASDGGYYLIGLSSMRREPFRDIPWSSENTLEVALKKTKAAGLKVELLEELTDIDDAEALQAVWERWQEVLEPICGEVVTGE